MVQFSDLRALTGNTPMIGIRYRYKGEERIIYSKCEHYNFTGSIKDRMALEVLEQASKRGELKPEDTIVEATSGNGGISLATFGRALGHRVIIVMPDWVSKERRDILLAIGVEIILISREEGGFLACIDKCHDLKASMPNVFLPQQFFNKDNAQGYFTSLGPEIQRQMESMGLKPNAFIAGIGTGGTIMGIGKYLRQHYPNMHICPLESLQSRIISTGVSHGIHRVSGLSDDWIPPIVDLSIMNDVFTISDGDGIIMTQRLGKELGIGVGISSGFNLLGAVAYQNKFGKHTNVITVFPDCNKKYLSSTLLQEEPRLPDYLNNHIELVDFFTVEN
jgi:cysteine synthase A